MRRVQLPTLAIVITGVFVLLVTTAASSFLKGQLNHHRVQNASFEKDALLRSEFQAQGIAYPPVRLYMRVFKSEKLLEMWASNSNSGGFQLVKTYDVCAMSGEVGPKRKQGDLQVPEGFYNIHHFNPNSAYHLSIRVDYPNKSDRKLSPHRNLGGDIFVHGQCGSLGCVAINDDQIKEVYWLTAQARSNGQGLIPIHIFPSRLSKFKYNILQHLHRKDSKMLNFWANLKKGYDYFEDNHKIPKVRIKGNGEYVFR